MKAELCCVAMELKSGSLVLLTVFSSQCISDFGYIGHLVILSHLENRAGEKNPFRHFQP